MKRGFILYIAVPFFVLFFATNITASEGSKNNIDLIEDYTKVSVADDNNFIDEGIGGHGLGLVAERIGNGWQIATEGFAVPEDDLYINDEHIIIDKREPVASINFTYMTNLYEITRFSFETQNITIYMPLGEEARQLDISLEAQPYHDYDLDYFTYDFTVPIHWRFDDFNSNERGYQTLYGDVTLPENYFNEGELPLRQMIYVYGPDENGPWNSAGAIIVIPSSYDANIIPLGGDVKQLNISTWANGYVKDTYEYVKVEVLWHYEEFDSSTPGRQILYGEFIVPEGYFYFGPPPEQCIIVYNDDIGVETIVRSYTGSGPGHVFRVPYGSDDKALNAFISAYGINAVGLNALQILFDRWDIPFVLYDINNEIEAGYLTLQHSVTYDLSLIDMDTPGIYYPFSALPEYFTLNDFAKQGIAIVVQEPDEVDLNGWTVDVFGTLSFGWYKGVASPELWVSIDEKDWQPIDSVADIWELFDFWESDDDLYYHLNILSNDFPEGHKYELMVRYENGGSSVNSMVFDFTKGKHVYNGNGGGPRDGDDREESNLPNPGNGTGGNKNDEVNRPPTEEDKQEYQEDSNGKQLSQAETAVDGVPKDPDKYNVTDIEWPYGNDRAGTIDSDVIEKGVNQLEDAIISEEVASEETQQIDTASESAFDNYQDTYLSNDQAEFEEEGSSIGDALTTEASVVPLLNEVEALDNDILVDIDVARPEDIGTIGNKEKSKMEQYISVAVAATISLFLAGIIWKVFGKWLVAHHEN